MSEFVNKTSSTYIKMNTLTWCMPKINKLESETMLTKPLSNKLVLTCQTKLRCMFEAIQGFLHLTYKVRFGLLNEALGLAHIYFLLQISIKESIVYINLMYRPLIGHC